jgi:hypothetical protein
MENLCPFLMFVGIIEFCLGTAQYEQRTIGGQYILAVINNSYVATFHSRFAVRAMLPLYVVLLRTTGYWSY